MSALDQGDATDYTEQMRPAERDEARHLHAAETTVVRVPMKELVVRPDRKPKSR